MSAAHKSESRTFAINETMRVFKKGRLCLRLLISEAWQIAVTIKLTPPSISINSPFEKPWLKASPIIKGSIPFNESEISGIDRAI